ncbi:hypothetical protein HDV04_006210 [Boothiomyces sp. JEL0838]|nr:hypothetical protein HDV04_000845 [Boothiomyces sp. JEL0838]KAJ3309371.1 hypothetical protein HDV04_006210 [Boothiomyces sp. JEL0838]
MNILKSGTKLITKSFHSSAINYFKKDPYQVLGVGKQASQNEIKKKYYQLAKEYHPDTNKDPKAKEKFIEIQSAYEILSDEQKRQDYDQFGHQDGQNPFQGNPFQGGNPFGFGGGNPFHDIFSSFRGFGGQMDNIGEDIMQRMNVTFMEACHGAQKGLSYQKIVTCTPCGGSGAKKGKQPTTCVQCGGAGQVIFNRGGFQMATSCPACGGKGKTIARGIDDGMRVRLQGQGDEPIEGNGRPGDLLIQINVSRHPQFKRDGANILLDVDVPLTTAILGGKINIPTIDGDVELNIPQGSQPGDRKILRQRGIANVNQRGKGDQIVTLKVKLPTSLTSKQKELLMEAFGDKKKTENPVEKPPQKQAQKPAEKPAQKPAEKKDEEKKDEKEGTFVKFFKDLKKNIK